MARSLEDDYDSDQYDPDQTMAERREVQRGIRQLLQETSENQDELLGAKSDSLQHILEKSNEYSHQTRQTTEAAMDARLILQLSETSYKRSMRYGAGSVANGVDVDEFVSKCITYMRQGRGIGDDNAAELSSTQRQRRVTSRRSAIGDDDDEEIVYGKRHE